jgi:hypothetical protein
MLTKRLNLNFNHPTFSVNSLRHNKDFKDVFIQIMERVHFWDIFPIEGKFVMARKYYIYRKMAIAYAKLIVYIINKNF